MSGIPAPISLTAYDLHIYDSVHGILTEALRGSVTHVDAYVQYLFVRQLMKDNDGNFFRPPSAFIQRMHLEHLLRPRCYFNVMQEMGVPETSFFTFTGADKNTERGVDPAPYAKRLFGQRFLACYWKDAHDKPMRIKTESITGAIREIDIDGYDLLRSFKQRYRDAFLDSEPGRFRVICNGKQIDEVHTLSEQGISEGDLLHIVPQLRGC